MASAGFALPHSRSLCVSCWPLISTPSRLSTRAGGFSFIPARRCWSAPGCVPRTGCSLANSSPPQPQPLRATSAAMPAPRLSRSTVGPPFPPTSPSPPPKGRRGPVLTAPPFEQPNEFARLADGLAHAHRKWPTGTYLAWYPIKNRRDSDAFARKLAGTGLMVINPPWTLEGELLVLLPALAGVLGRGRPGTFRLDRLTTKN